MDDRTLMILGLVAGVALLYLGGRIRRRSLQRPRPSDDPGHGDSA